MQIASGEATRKMTWNLTVERLRMFNPNVKFVDKTDLRWDVDTLFERLEREDFNNDTERNVWLKKQFGNQEFKKRLI